MYVSYPFLESPSGTLLFFFLKYECVQGPVESPLRNRLASMLASLIRFHLRIRLDAPPEKLTRAPEVLPSAREASYSEEKRRAEVSPPGHFSKVC